MGVAPRGTKLWVLLIQNLKIVNCQMSPVIIFRLNTLKGTDKAPAVDLLRLNTLRGTKTAFLIPTRNDEQPRPFYKGVPPPPPGSCSPVDKNTNLWITSPWPQLFIGRITLRLPVSALGLLQFDYCLFVYLFVCHLFV